MSQSKADFRLFINRGGKQARNEWLKEFKQARKRIADDNPLGLERVALAILDGFDEAFEMGLAIPNCIRRACSSFRACEDVVELALLCNHELARTWAIQILCKEYRL